jgi:hypothetical protein
VGLREAAGGGRGKCCRMKTWSSCATKPSPPAAKARRRSQAEGSEPMLTRKGYRHTSRQQTVAGDQRYKGLAALEDSELHEEVEAAHVTVAAHGHVEGNAVQESSNLRIARVTRNKGTRHKSHVTCHTSHVTSELLERTHSVAWAGIQLLVQESGDCKVGNLEQRQQGCKHG